MENIYDHVLFIGPMKNYGGIGSVLEVYSNNIRNFKFISTYPSTLSEKNILKSKLYKLGFFIKSTFKILNTLLTDREIKIVHLHSSHKGSFYRKAIIVYLAKLCSKKVVFHIHSSNFKSFYQDSRLKFFIQSTLKKSDKVICLSKQSQEYYINDFKLTNTTIVANPVELDAMAGPKKGIPEIINLLFLGKISNAKGIFDLIEFLQKNKYFLSGHLKLTIAGNGETERLKQLLFTNNLATDQIEFIGWVKDERKRQAIAACDIYILPSYFEALPVSILEAMANNKPIIATNVGGVSALVKNNYNGWLIPAGSFNDLERVFEEIFDNKTILNFYGNNSYNESKKYSPGMIFPILTNLYNSLLEQAGVYYAKNA